MKKDTLKFRNKYRIPSARAPWHDYRAPGAYFITICTRNRRHYFGKIRNHKMILSPLGTIADILWHEIPHRNPSVALDAFVVMPNHIHGILIIEPHAPATPDGPLHADGPAVQTLHATPPPTPDPPSDPAVQTLHATSLPQIPPSDKSQSMADISPKSQSISTLIRSYKSAVTKHANRLGLQNGWHTRFHDHIIRNAAEHRRIAYYILHNPENWDGDKFHAP